MKPPSRIEPTASAEVKRPARRAPRTGRLRVVFPPRVTATIAVGRDALTLGRDPEDGATAIDHPTVSRRHLRVTWDDAAGVHAVTDLGSRNGTRVDGARIAAAAVPLADGAVLRVGDVLAVYELDAAVPDATAVSREHIPGDAAATQRLRAAVARAAVDPSPVLLIGETGTGKELIAHELHRLSRRPGPFLAVNCAALARELVESQLFGHVKGAFTGATAAHLGLFRSAAHGSLFLDEIGELPGDLQPKLLRVIQEGEVQPVGSASSARVDVRIIAASNRDVADMARQGTFRSDLYARLSLWEIRVPSLRARRADLFTWVARLFTRWTEQRDRTGLAPLSFDADGAELLLRQPFALNLRDLDRLVHALATTAERPITAELLAAELGAAPAPDATQPRARRRSSPTREELEAVLRDSGGRIRQAALRLGCDRRQIYRWMKQYGLSRPADGEEDP